jgi:hypothetical protein
MRTQFQCMMYERAWKRTRKGLAGWRIFFFDVGKSFPHIEICFYLMHISHSQTHKKRWVEESRTHMNMSTNGTDAKNFYQNCKYSIKSTYIISIFMGLNWKNAVTGSLYIIQSDNNDQFYYTICASVCVCALDKWDNLSFA